MLKCEFNFKLLCNFIETTLRRGCSPVNLLHIFRAAYYWNISGWMLLKAVNSFRKKLHHGPLIGS